MDRHCIQYDKDRYRPGDWVSGTVNFNFDKDLRARFVKIGWRCESGHHGMGGRGGSKGRSRALFSGSNYPWKAEDGWNKIPSGKQSFPFLFQLPLDMPPSHFSRRAGTAFISYTVGVRIERPWNFNYTCRKGFHVVPSMSDGIPAPPLYSEADRAPPPMYQGF